MRHRKLIVWGAKFDTGHTHAFVHDAIVRAGEYLKIPTYWMDNRDNVPDDFFDDALIISEQWLVFANGISHKLPLRPTSTYLIHYLGNKGPVEGNPSAGMYLGKVGRLIDFRFATNWGINGIEDKNYAYRFEKEKYTQINDGTSFFEQGSEYDIFYSIWATDLLPNEINFDARLTPFKEPHYAFFGGTIREDNQEMFIPFVEECKKDNIPFVYNSPWQNPLTVEQMRNAVVQSYLPLDARPQNHLANGYISCRSIKNISYGSLCLTNSKETYDFFDQEVAYASDTGELFHVAQKMQKDHKTKDLILNQMKKVKNKHTYINRLYDMITASEMAWQK
jgi:hypothetical protein